MALNAEDGGHRRCISVQMPEVLDESSEAYKAGYRTIADITRARTLLGWEPKVELEEGLVKTIEYFRTKVG